MAEEIKLKNKCEMASKAAALVLWIFLFGNSACSKFKDFPNKSMTIIGEFPGISAEANPNKAILSDLIFTENGDIATLERDSGRIAIFNKNGQEKSSFLFSFPENQSVETVAVNEKNGLFSVLDLKNAQLNTWTAAGQLVQQNKITPAIISRTVSFAADGDFYSSAEGVRDKSFILHYDKSGNLRDTLGTNQLPPLQRDFGKSLAQQIAEGDIPTAFNDSVLLAARQNRVYALQRSRPILQCFRAGTLLFEKKLHLPELAEIRQAITIRNRLLEAENHYIPLSYWSDFTIDNDEQMYILLSLQKEAVVYHLDQNGNIVRRLTGQPGKAHMIAVQNQTLAIGDAISGEITVYRI